ncbi:rplI [Acrasis kona]|uniref:RplI n=1 Tax=Acrasis kona TaxID=1008807 RepID=A0AAW2ZES3_9EUKA
MSSVVHVVSKQDVSKHSTFSLDNKFPKLLESSVRVQTKIVSLTSNNLTYAKLGDYLKWWGTYPVPECSPSPYNNRDNFGIVPAWGYAEVIESTIEKIKPGVELWGFWPTSSHPVDLKLVEAEPKGHWIEVSQQRSELMSLYNRYIEVTSLNDDEKAWNAALCVWECGYLINRYTFPDDNKTSPIHPLGVGLPWSSDDADLTSSVVVSLSASSKTARSFAWQLKRNRNLDANGPLGLLQVSSNPEKSSDDHPTNLHSEFVSYKDITSEETIKWITKFQPKRVVIFDFGSPPSVVDDLKRSLKSWSSDLNVLVVGVASQGDVQFNTSGVRDKVIERQGAAHFKSVHESLKRCLNEKGMGELELVWGQGVQGANGIEGSWDMLCNGRLDAKKAYVFKL